MATETDWTTWALIAVVGTLFVSYFAWVGREMFTSARQLFEILQNWAQVRRAMVEDEVRSGGRYPLWFRVLRAVAVLCLIGLSALMIWNTFK